MRTFSSAENRRRVRRWISRTTCSVLAPLPIRLLLPVGPGVSLSSTPYVVHIALTANTPGPLRAGPCRRQHVGRREPRCAAQRLPCRGSNAAEGRANDIHPGELKTVGAKHPAQPSVAKVPYP